jgi:hypothetical protein
MKRALSSPEKQEKQARRLDLKVCKTATPVSDAEEKRLKRSPAKIDGTSESSDVQPTPPSRRLEVEQVPPPVDPANAYAVSITANLRAAEASCQPVQPTFLEKHKELSPYKRMVVVDWLMEVHDHLNPGGPDALFLAVRTFDRFLAYSKEAIRVRDVQAVAAACYLAASKFEDNGPVRIRELATYAATEAKELVAWERKVLLALDFDIAVPTLWSFTRHWKLVETVDNTDLSNGALAELTAYFAERALLYADLAAFLPSRVAALATRATHLCVRTVADESGLFAPAGPRSPVAARVLAHVKKFIADIHGLEIACCNKSGVAAVDRRWPFAAKVRRRTFAREEDLGQVAAPLLAVAQFPKPLPAVPQPPTP